MRKDEIGSKIRHAFTSVTPDIKDSVISSALANRGKDVIRPMKTTNNKNRISKIIAICASVAAVVAIAVFGGLQYTNNYKVESIVSIDVNPAVEIKVARSERVIDVIALNDDGQTIIGDMKLKGSDVEVAVNALVGSMLKNGYITELANSVLVSVEGNDDNASAALRERLAQEVEATLAASSVNGAILSQVVDNSDSELHSLAKQYGISVGKAKLIRSIIAVNNTLTFEELAPLTINELNLLRGEKVAEDVGTTGAPSDKEYIGAEKALAIALDHAGVAQADAREIETELDYERGVMTYEVEFKSAGMEYDYEINAKTGEIIRSRPEIDDDYREPSTSQPVTSQPVTSQPVTSQPSAQYIDKDKAVRTALEHAGVARANARELEAELDTDDGVTHYDVEFKSGGKEYDYEINAVTGEIIRFESEIDD